MAVDLGTAYISVVPTTKDLDKGIRQALNNSVKQADRAGDDMGAKLASNVTTHLGKAGDKSAQAFGKTFTPKVASAGKNAMLGLGNLMVGSAEGIGSQVGGGITGGIATAISRSSGRVVDSLSGIATAGGSAMSSKLVAAGTVAAGGIALITTAAIVAGKELYNIGAVWDGVADGITFSTGLVGDRLNEVNNSIKNVAANTAATIGDIANVSAALVKGLKLQPGKGLEQITQQIAQYNAAAQENGGEPLNIREFIKAVKQLNLDGDVEGIATILNDLYKVTQNTTIPMNDLVRVLKTLGPQAQQFKIPAQQLVQILAAMEDSGLNSETAIMGLRTAWKNLEDLPDPAGGLRDKIAEIRQLLMSTDEAAQTAGDKMANEFFGNRAGPALADAIRNGNLELDNFNTKAGDTGLTIGEMTRQTQDFAQEWQRFKNFLTSGLEPVATAVFGGINTGLEAIVTNIRSYLDILGGGDGKVDVGLGPMTTGTPGAPSLGGGPNASRERRGLPPVTGGGLLGGSFDANNSGAMAGTPGSGYPLPNQYGGLIGNAGSTGAGGLNWANIDAIAANRGLTMTSGYRDPNGPTLGGVPAWRSYHGYGRARDYAGTPAQNAAFYNLMKSTYGSQLKELLYEDVGTANEHVHVAFADGGGVSGRGGPKSDSIPAMLSNGEHVLTAKDVDAMGGQGGVYSFRNALHRANGGEILKLAAVSGQNERNPYGDGAERKDRAPSGNPLDPINGDPSTGIIMGPSFGTRGPWGDMGWFFPWWERFVGDNKLDPLTPGGKIRQNVDMYGMPAFAEGGAVNPDELLKLAAEQGVDPNTLQHGMSKGQPGPTADQLKQAQATSDRTQGFVPVAASNTGVAGTSVVSSLLNMGSEAIGGLIDAGAQAAQLAAAAALAGTSGGGGAAAGPAAGAGIQIAAEVAKRGVSYGFQLAGIGADSLIEQLFPFGAPRWLGYDYTSFAPNMGGMGTGVTTLEKAQNQAAGQPVAPGQEAGGPVNPSTMPGVAQPITETQGGVAPGPMTSSGQPLTAIPTTRNMNPDMSTVNESNWLSKMMGYDQGGMLPPGGIGINMTNRPEPVLTPQQWDSMEAMSQPGTGGPLVKIDNIYGMSPDDVANKIEAKQKLAMMRYAGRP